MDADLDFDLAQYLADLDLEWSLADHLEDLLNYA